MMWFHRGLRFYPALIVLLAMIVSPQDAQSNQVIELYTMWEYTVEVPAASYENPFDPEEIEVYGIFNGPTGDNIVVNGFWMQPYEDRCEGPCEIEDLQPTGEPEWRVRFTPRAIGDWNYRIEVRQDGELLSSATGQFSVEDSDRAGFITMGRNRRYFAHDDGTSYFPIGHNMHWSWPGGGGLRAYLSWLDQLSANDGNYARLYIDIPWFINLEWQRPVGDYRAAQEAAARLDTILEVAEERGIYLQLVLLWHQALTFYDGPPVLLPDTFPRPRTLIAWDDNPYNVFNGGPLSGPGVFFTNEEARGLFQRRLRYIVARWAHSPNVFVWEIIDEIDRTVNYNPAVADEWLQSMTSYLRQIDPYEHLVTAGSRQNYPAIVGSPLLDFSASRYYQRLPIESDGDHVSGVLDVIRRNLQMNGKATLLTGHSLNPWFEPTTSDPEGIHFQTALWVAALSGSSGGAIGDYWYTYIIPQELQRYYRPLAAFVTGIDWHDLQLRPAEAAITIPADAEIAQPVRISTFDRQFQAVLGEPPSQTITADGVYPGVERVSAFLYGQVFSSQLSFPQAYRFSVPVDTWMEIAIRSVSSDAAARLQVMVDGEVRTELSLEPGSRGSIVRVNLAAGEREVVLRNVGDDWLQLDYIEVASLVIPLRTLTLRDSDAGVALSWLQHRDYNWQAVSDGVERESIRAAYRLAEMPPGRYTVEIWNPLTGQIMGDEIVMVGDDGMLRFDLLPINNQLALRVFRLPSVDD